MFHGNCRKISKVLSLAVDETKLCIKKAWVYVYSAIDIDSKELLALEVSYGRSCLNALINRK